MHGQVAADAILGAVSVGAVGAAEGGDGQLCGGIHQLSPQPAVACLIKILEQGGGARMADVLPSDGAEALDEALCPALHVMGEDGGAEDLSAVVGIVDIFGDVAPVHPRGVVTAHARR